MITLDVQRSISTMPGVDAEALQRVLKAYAVHHPEFGYCQGMNFVAGFIMMIYNDETTTFRVLVALMRKFKIEELFDSQLPRLRLFFFQLDRLVGVAEPELCSHLAEEEITAGLFASGWFITLFTNVLRENADGDSGRVNENLMQLWDYFLVSGWKALIKFVVLMLTESATSLSKAKFEDILLRMNDLPKGWLEPVEPSLDSESTDTLFVKIRRRFKGLMMTFHLERLAVQFELSHCTVAAT